MKRSDAVNHIMDILSGLYPPSTPYKDAALDILTTLENIGMTPPGYTRVFATGEKYNKKKHQGRDVHWCTAWEPEDETK